MKKGAILLASVIIVGMMFSSAWAQSIQDITWSPASPVVGQPVKFIVKVVNPGPNAPICIRLVAHGGNPEKQTHPGIGIRKAPPINVGFGPVTYGAPGVYNVTAQIMDKNCERLVPGIPYRTERITVRPR